MMVLRLILLLQLSAIPLLVGCNAEREVDKSALEGMVGGELKKTIPVSGTVSIKGAPTESVKIYAYTKESGMQPAAQTHTRADGTYCWTTYEPCDGLPLGEYRLGFAHIPDEGKGKKQGEDLLKGKYRDPSKNEFTLTVKGTEPMTDVNYDLE